MIKINDGVPVIAGNYVIYTDHVFTPRFAGRNLLLWEPETGKWFYPLSSQPFRGNVYGWIGPLPAMELTDEISVDDLL